MKSNKLNTLLTGIIIGIVIIMLGSGILYFMNDADDGSAEKKDNNDVGEAEYFIDSDGDGWSDGLEKERGADPHDASICPPIWPDDYKKDSDGDGWSDGDEMESGTNPHDHNDYPLLYYDEEGEELEEFEDGEYDEYEVDSDGDGWSDGDENDAGTDPYDDEDYPEYYDDDTLF